VPDPLGSLVDAVASIIDHLERAGIDYAIGGAVSYSAWAEPRATRDIDLNIWVTADRLDRAFDVLTAAGVELDRAAARKDAEDRGMFVGRAGEYRVDVFVPSVAFYAEALRRRRRVRLAHRDTWVLSAETLAVFKMLFFRPKDLVDVQRLLEIQAEHMDCQFVRRSLVEMLGEDDERIRSWDQIVGRVATAPSA
jgi:hypothetical protein